MSALDRLAVSSPRGSRTVCYPGVILCCLDTERAGTWAPFSHGEGLPPGPGSASPGTGGFLATFLGPGLWPRGSSCRQLASQTRLPSTKWPEQSPVTGLPSREPRERGNYRRRSPPWNTCLSGPARPALWDAAGVGGPASPLADPGSVPHRDRDSDSVESRLRPGRPPLVALCSLDQLLLASSLPSPRASVPAQHGRPAAGSPCSDRASDLAAFV